MFWRTAPPRALRHLEGPAPQQPQPHRLPEDREAVQDGGARAAAEAVRATGASGGADAGGRDGEQVPHLSFHPEASQDPAHAAGGRP